MHEDSTSDRPLAVRLAFLSEQSASLASILSVFCRPGAVVRQRQATTPPGPCRYVSEMTSSSSKTKSHSALAFCVCLHSSLSGQA